MQCALHPDSWWAHPEEEYLVSPEAAWQGAPWYAVRR